MSRVIAFVDESTCAGDVLATADGLGRLLSASVDVVTVRPEDDTGWGGTRRARVVVGPVHDVLVAELNAEDVLAGVVGSRATDLPHRRVGHVAERLVTVATRPLLVVPPGAGALSARPRLLVPLDGTTRTAKAVAPVVDLLRSTAVEVVTMHVFDPESLPALVSSPEDRRTIADEFDAIHCGGRSDSIELRVGVPESHIPDVAEQLGADAIVLAWEQSLAPGHAAVVRRLLDADVRLILVGVAEHRGPSERTARAART
jgi:nucleotide-binding universal stress UspA family protein